MTAIVEIPGNTTTVTVTGTSPLTVEASQERGPQGASGFLAQVRSDAVSPYTYIGVAPVGSVDADAAWKIIRILQASDGTVTTAVADGVAWDDRLTATYS